MINLEHEMYDYTGNKCSHWNNNTGFKEKFGIEFFCPLGYYTVQVG
jgi:hypothetical protein